MFGRAPSPALIRKDGRNHSPMRAESPGNRSYPPGCRRIAQAAEKRYVETRRSLKSIDKMRACNRDHHDIANWIPGGNGSGYWCKCEGCWVRMNHVIKYEQKTELSNKNRMRGDVEFGSSKIFPEDERCAYCESKGCLRRICAWWKEFVDSEDERRNRKGPSRATFKPEKKKR